MRQSYALKHLPKYVPEGGEYLVPDGWRVGEKTSIDDGFKDDSFPGCAFRIASHDYQIAINVEVTGRPHWNDWDNTDVIYRSRVKIEWVGDGEPSEFSGGWIFHK